MTQRLLLGVAFGVLVYLGIILWLDLSSILDALKHLELWILPLALLCALCNYAIRFLKWERYRKLLGIEIDLRTSITIYLAGFSMGITPGKMGEVFKSWMLRKVDGTPIHKSAPIVVAERVTDLLGYLILVALSGLFSHPDQAWIFALVLLACLGAIVVLSSRRVSHSLVLLVGKTPWLWRVTHKAEGALESARVLLAPRELLVPTLQSVLSWGLECVAFWFIASGLIEGGVPFQLAVFAYASSAVLGAVALVFPGGLGITEASMGAQLRPYYQDRIALGAAGQGLGADELLAAARAKAAGALILTRLCTLWFAVSLGLLALWIFRRRYGRIEDEPERASDS